MDIALLAGIVGIIAAVLGAKTVVCTDLPRVITTASDHIHRYKLQNAVKTSALEWGDTAQTNSVQRIHSDKPFDALIASDLAAPVSCVQDLLRTLRELMDGGDGIKEAWILLQDHREFTEPFVKACQEDDKLTIKVIPLDKLPTTQRSDRHTIYKVYRS
eukprot:gb/GECG01012293.1/.p1 GENE.gb/GECG01012293.1/~~gb/GECG01012293.1/.p1  ORF type:complete len:159 (+),score=13.14 gb/GECG01012293.1/:1-477(+)